MRVLNKLAVLGLIVLLSITGTIEAQEYKVEGSTLVKVEKPARKGAVKTSLTVEIKGVNYPVFKGKKGGYYIVRTSKKTGKTYKQYLKVKK